MNKKAAPKFTVAKLIALAKEPERAVSAGRMRPEDDVCVSLEVCKDGDEETFQNRVHGGAPVQVCLVNEANKAPTVTFN